MAPTVQLAPQAFTPTSDAMGRHEYGVTKTRKTASTGGGRAWSEEEELYLLQTRLQKMPYKHIAAHLKKTELACRLHYHQLSHGSSRRKRTTSVSSGSSSNGLSPLMPLPQHSPIREATASRSSSPPGSASYVPVSPHTSGIGGGSGVQLPSIVGGHGSSPRLPSILPKPAAMTLPPLNTSPTRSYPTPLPEPHSALPSATFSHPPTPPLRRDAGLPLPSARHTHVDMARLQAVYTAHRAPFWAAVAGEYGGGANPAALEQAWRAGACCQGAPLTPAASPEHGEGRDRTRISAIMGMEAQPRSPQDHLMVRRMEEERCVAVSA